ncbi:hypothetical protein [uncultured Lacinutrix sp.]|uniref:hypothetical protein n=1 Tax=uncultured Lacinutrix sp. TaxID=574032 RepID=UPI002616A0E3|nr:hypothetical protein [uncultured Lacinutrix sp.]
MKALNYYPILIVAFVLSISFYGCSKEENEEQSIATEKVFDKIINITNNYIKTNNSLHSRADLEELVKTDIAAGLISYTQGNSTNDAIIDGLAASAKAYFASEFNPGNTNGDIGLLDNEYDYIGRYHVQILDNIIKDESGIYIQDGVLNYEQVLEYSNQFMSFEGLNNYSGDFTDLKISVNNSITKLSEAGNLVSNLVSNEGQVNMILKNYFLALESSGSANAFVEFSKTIETLIINSQEFSNEDKEYLLMNMATSRYDYSYWKSDFETKKTNEKNQSLINKYSFSNPKEYIGIEHNEALIYVFENLHEKPKKDQIKSVVENLLSSYYSNTVSLPNFPESFDNLNLYDWVDSADISNSLKTEVYNTFQILQTASSLEEIVTLINQKESIASSLFEGSELDLYYEHLAVTKYSANFWYPTFEGGLNGVSYIQFEDDIPFQTIDWWKVIAADCVGGFFGGLGGAAAASILNIIGQM